MKTQPRAWPTHELAELAEFCVDKEIVEATILMLAKKWERTFFSVRNKVTIIRHGRPKAPIVAKIIDAVIFSKNRPCAKCERRFDACSPFITRCDSCKEILAWSA